MYYANINVNYISFLKCPSMPANLNTDKMRFKVLFLSTQYRFLKTTISIMPVLKNV